MYKVSTYNLSADFRHAQADLGSNEIGSLTSEQLYKILEQFREIDAAENNDAMPRIDVSTVVGRFNIHTADQSRMTKELPALEILDYLANPQTGEQGASRDTLGTTTTVQAPKKGMNHSIAFAMLVVGLALNGYTLYSAFYIADINVALPLVLLTEKNDIKKQTEILAGTYVTGAEVGDRCIVVAPDGVVRLQEFAAKGTVRNQSSHPFGFGKRDDKLFIAMKPKGQIEVANRDTLVLYGDTYKRMK